MPSERDQVDRLIVEGTHRTLQLQEHLALALMVAAKWDKAYDQHGAEPLPDQVAACDRFTEREMGEHRDAATRMMGDYAAAVAQKRLGWLVPITQGIAASFIYSLLLILAALVLKYIGIDLISVGENIVRRG